MSKLKMKRSTLTPTDERSKVWIETKKYSRIVIPTDQGIQSIEGLTQYQVLKIAAELIYHVSTSKKEQKWCLKTVEEMVKGE